MSGRKVALFAIASSEVLALDLRIPLYLLTSLSTPFLMASMCQVLNPASPNTWRQPDQFLY